jgi:hypothetical protein
MIECNLALHLEYCKCHTVMNLNAEFIMNNNYKFCNFTDVTRCSALAATKTWSVAVQMGYEKYCLCVPIMFSHHPRLQKLDGVHSAM